MDISEKTRNESRPLSYEQQLLFTEIRGIEEDFIRLCNKIGKSHELSLAVINMEQAGMWAVRHIIGRE